MTKLFLSAVYGHLDIVKYLIECGANIHANYDVTLLRSATNDHLHIVNFLKSIINNHQ